MEDLDLREDLGVSKGQIKEGAAWAALSYVFFLWILAFSLKKDENPFVRFHARQGIVIFVGEVICLFLLTIPVIGPLFCRLGLIVLFAMALCGMVSALLGRMSRIWIVSDLAQKIVV